MARRRTQDANQLDFFESRDRAVEGHIDRFADALRQAGKTARNQEGIRIAVERQFERMGDDLGLQIQPEPEFTLLRGSIDSVYGSVFIEYKSPASASERLGPHLSSPGTRKVVKQIERRFADVRSMIGSIRGGLLGIGCDGRYFVFCRLFDGQMTVEEPVEVSRWSCRRFIFALLNLGNRGLPLIPEWLARDFGSQSELTVHGVGAFAQALAENLDDPRVEAFFRQWRVLFGEVCGYDVQHPRKSIKVLAEHYDLSAEKPAELLFALHTYYALFMKLLAAHVAMSFQRIGASPLDELSRAPSSRAFRRKLDDLEAGSIFVHLGVTNFLEGDLFAWYLSAFTDEVENAIREIVERLLEYSPGSLRDNPSAARDLLKKLYHELFPRQVRHDIGEYYTPDWLAELTLDRAGYDGDPRTRILDPACGSGTFLVLAMARVRRWLEAHYDQAPDQTTLARLVQENIQGFDLNPLAVLAARTNYLIQFYDLFDYRGEIEIPIYLCDSVLTPFEFGEPGGLDFTKAPIKVPTSAKLFEVPREVTAKRDILSRYTTILAEYARAGSGFTEANFVQRCRHDGLPVSEDVEDQHRKLFKDIRALDRDRRNGVWARYIKNAFAPVFLRNHPVDLVVGNPPWINWENLPGRMEAEGAPNYRQQVAEVFKRYGLFSLSGSAGRLGGGKKDLSMVFVYACIDHFLKDRGKLAFVITQTVFKTKGAGDGFRRFKYDEHTGERGRRPHVYLGVQAVDDLSDFQPFEGATNRTAVFVCRKSKRATHYPVRYTTWKKVRSGRIGFDWPLGEVKAATSRAQLGATPVNSNAPTSPWLTAPPDTLTTLRKLIGNSHYQAHAGACTWLNGVFWVRIVRETPRGVLIENLNDIGKIEVDRARCSIEPDLLYPLLRGRDVRRWRAEPSAWIILAQDPKTRTGIPENEMRRRYPRTWSYLKKFEKQLRERSGYKKYYDPSDPFYSMYNVGAYLLAHAKVVWNRIDTRLQAVVVDEPIDRKLVLCQETHCFVDFEDRDEARYFSAAFNSAPSDLLVRSYSVSKGFASTHVLGQIAIPQFDRKNPLHQHLARLSHHAHEAAAHGRQAELYGIEEQIDRAAAKLWGLTKKELKGIQTALRAEAEPEEPSLLDEDDDG